MGCRGGWKVTDSVEYVDVQLLFTLRLRRRFCFIVLYQHRFRAPSDWLNR